MRKLVSIAAVAACAFVQPAAAQITGAANVNVTNPTTFSLSGNTFTFDYDPVAAAAFDPATYSVMTGGTAQTSAFGGFLGIPLTPSLFDTSGVYIDGNLFPSYAAFPNLTAIPYSLVPGDLALRYFVGADAYYGFARLNGDGTLNIAFNTQANTGITAGSAFNTTLSAVPEPGTWAMMLVGFGAIGFAMRSARKRRVTAAA